MPVDVKKLLSDFILNEMDLEVLHPYDLRNLVAKITEAVQDEVAIASEGAYHQGYTDGQESNYDAAYDEGYKDGVEEGRTEAFAEMREVLDND